MKWLYNFMNSCVLVKKRGSGGQTLSWSTSQLPTEKKTNLIEQHNYNIILSSYLEKTANTVRPAQRSGYERESIPRNERNMGDAHAKDDRKLRLCRASTSNTLSLASGFYLT